MADEVRSEPPVPVEQMLSNKLYLIPLAGRPIFPGIFTPLMINSPEDTKVVEQAYKENGFLGICLLKNEAEAPGVPDLHSVGTVARIIKKINLPDGGVNIFVSTIKRFKLRKTLNIRDPMLAIVEYLEDEEDQTHEVKALTRALIAEMREVSENNPLFSEEMRLNMVNIDHPGKIADFIASILNIDKNDQQQILEMLNVRRRMEQVLVYIKREQELLRIQKKIQGEINDRIEKQQREYFLKEELKNIKEELGMATDAKTSDYQKFKEKLDAFGFDGEIKEAVESELEKFQLMEPNSAEYIVTRNYLEIIAGLPWGEAEAENFNLKQAKKILERDHYGLEDVKKRIMEYLAVRKLKKDSKGSILLLVGPPGVGKTSVGRSIASAMGKPFFRFSVGGMRDEAEIKGHRRTYIGALPGKIIQGLKIVKHRSPVFMIDEVDKMGESFQGDPTSALLEVLDPEQNVSFRDHYLDLPFDISDVFFILTANTTDDIPSPLLDRAEIINLSGYIDQEKIEIARKYLIPKNLVKNGLKKNQIKYTAEALHLIAESYARESGVRNYEKSLDKIHRKLISELFASDEVITLEAEYLRLKKAEDDVFDEAEAQAEAEAKKAAALAAKKKKKAPRGAAPPEEAAPERDAQTAAAAPGVPEAGEDAAPEVKPEPKPPRQYSQAVKDAERVLGEALSRPRVIGKEDVEKYLGKPVFDESQIIRADKAGTAVGLAWTNMGGDTLLIEAVAFQGKEGFQITGQLGDVMKESASIALTWAKRFVLAENIADTGWFEKNTIHLHIPEGATPKDGPSAGITMSTALLSLLKDKQIKPNWAMTGELSLTGQVLPIGGLKEKTVAAKRNKIKHIIIPRGNERDLEKIPDHVKKGLAFHPVSRMDEVVSLVF
ncbi:MAG: endopeptidase La [Spirochaetaceae bacterium]|jgi:ATP-dependent Lon protease|nr:endopeptidase La [Spirochaetaceae bacterium]